MNVKIIITLCIIQVSFFLGIKTTYANDHVILAGGPALIKWEKLRLEKDQHDRWWANFIRASTLRMDDLRSAYGSSASIIWLVYDKAYAARGPKTFAPGRN